MRTTCLIIFLIVFLSGCSSPEMLDFIDLTPHPPGPATPTFSWQNRGTYQAQAYATSDGNEFYKAGIQAEETAQAAVATADGFSAIRAQTQDAASTATQAAVDSANRAATFESARLTEEVSSTQQARAYEVQGWTATAGANQATSTAVVEQTQGALQFAIIANQATATAQKMRNQQEAARLDLEKKSKTNMLWELTIWAMFVMVPALAIGTGIFIIKNRARFKVIPIAPSGDSHKVLIDGYRVIDPDRSLFPVTDIRKADNPVVPLDVQVQLAAGDQRVDAVRAMPRTINQQLMPGSSNFAILAQNDLPPQHLLSGGPDVSRVLDNDWSQP